MSWSQWRQTLVKMNDLCAITDNLRLVRERLLAASQLRTPELKEIFPSPRLVAVSKTKPKETIIQAYREGQRHFGENYVQELVDKATDPELDKECPEMKIHFIGHLQKNKISKLLAVANKLFVVETIDSEGLAKNVNDGLGRRNATEKLNVMVQVNTSGEESKSGVNPDQCVQLVKYVKDECPHLKFIGLMTIGAIEPENAEPNRDFSLLFSLREEVCKELSLERNEVELSMGMSADFEEAIQLGSTNVRVGSTIFGSRQKIEATSG